MAYTLQTMRKRDHKEKELKTLHMSMNVVEQDAHVRRAQFDKKLEDYQQWKKAEGIEGVFY